MHVDPRAYDPPTAPEKGRGGLVFGVVAVVAVAALALSGLGYAGYGAYRRALERRQVERADARFAQVPARLVAVERALAAVDFASPTAARRTLGDASAEVDAIARDVALAHGYARGIPVPQATEAYAAGVDEAAAGVDAARATIERAETLARLREVTREGLAKANQGTALVSEAIGDGNREDYGSQESKAGRAVESLSEAERLFAEAERIDPSAGLDEATAWAERTRVEAEAVRGQAEAGSAGDIPAYNRAVAEVNALTEEVNSMPHPPALTGGHWADAELKAKLGDVQEHARKAGADLAEAHRLLEGR